MGQDGRLAAVVSHDGRFEVFLQNSQGVHHYWQLPNTLKWVYYGEPYLPEPFTPTDLASVSPFADDYRTTIVAGRDGGGRIMAAWISQGNVYYAAAPYPGSSLNIPGEMIYGLVDIRALALGSHDDGALEIFGLDKNGIIYSVKQAVYDVWAWREPVSWGADQYTFSKISIDKLDGAMYAFGLIKKDSSGVFAVGAVIGIPGVNPDAQGNFTATQFFDGYELQALVARQSIDQRLELFAIGQNNQLYHRYEKTDRTGMTPWAAMFGYTTNNWGPPLQVVSDGNGLLQVIANFASKFGENVPDKDYNLYSLPQAEPNGGFDANAFELPEFGKEFGPTATATNQAGTVALFLYNVGAGTGEFPITVGTWPNGGGWDVPQLVTDNIAG